MKKLNILLLAAAFCAFGACAQNTKSTAKKVVKTEQCADCKKAGKDAKECAKNHAEGKTCDHHLVKDAKVAKEAKKAQLKKDANCIHDCKKCVDKCEKKK